LIFCSPLLSLFIFPSEKRGGYFDRRQLPRAQGRGPVILLFFYDAKVIRLLPVGDGSEALLKSAAFQATGSWFGPPGQEIGKNDAEEQGNIFLAPNDCAWSSRWAGAPKGPGRREADLACWDGKCSANVVRKADRYGYSNLLWIALCIFEFCLFV